MLYHYNKLVLILSAFFLLSETALRAQSTWTAVPSPNPSADRSMLRGISGTSGTDIWAVGHYQTSPQLAQFTSKNLMIRWNGTSWQQYTVPNPGVNINDLWDIGMVSPTDGWAVGTYDNYSQGVQCMLLRWNGSTWTQHSFPNSASAVGLESVHVQSASDVWIVGRASNNVALSMRYNGSSWNTVSVPAVGSFRNQLLSVHGASANDVWAVGSYSNSYGDYRCLAVHWNGSSWTSTALPTAVMSQLGELSDVKMVSANDVWAVGSYLTGGMVMLHWDGNAWSTVASNGGGGALAAVSSNNVYAVGGEISKWNGSTWTKIDSLAQYPYPALGDAIVLPDGEAWAAGRVVDANNVFTTLVYRSNGGAGSSACNAPAGLVSAAVTSSSASLSWTPATGATGYKLQWKADTAATWTTVTNIAAANYALSGLQPSTTYKFRVQTLCGGGNNSAYSATSSFVTTTAGCTVPSMLSVSNVTANTATLNWTAVPGASSYILQWRINGGTWATANVIANTSYQLAGLNPYSQYSFKVRTKCSQTTSSSYAPAFNFYTASACGNNFEPNETGGTAALLAAGAIVQEKIGSATDKDYYKLSNTNATPDIQVSLTNLPADYTMKLYKGSTLVASSSNGGTADETITYNTTVTGLYKVLVEGASGAFNSNLCYKLSVKLGSNGNFREGNEVEVAIVETADEPTLSLYPNPALGEVFLNYYTATGQTAIITILDAAGKTVLTEQRPVYEGVNKSRLDIGSLAAGVYYVRFVTTDYTTSEKLIVTH